MIISKLLRVHILFFEYYSSALNADCNFHAGDTVNLLGYVAVGFITSGSTQVTFIIEFNKNINGLTPSIVIPRLSIRQNGTYLNTAELPVDIKISITGEKDYFTQVTLTKDSGWGGINNDIVSLTFGGGSQIIFQ